MHLSCFLIELPGRARASLQCWPNYWIQENHDLKMWKTHCQYKQCSLSFTMIEHYNTLIIYIYCWNCNNHQQDHYNDHHQKHHICLLLRIVLYSFFYSFFLLFLLILHSSSFILHLHLHHYQSKHYRYCDEQHATCFNLKDLKGQENKEKHPHSNVSGIDTGDWLHMRSSRDLGSVLSCCGKNSSPENQDGQPCKPTHAHAQNWSIFRFLLSKSSPILGDHLVNHT